MKKRIALTVLAVYMTVIMFGCASEENLIMPNFDGLPQILSARELFNSVSDGDEYLDEDPVILDGSAAKYENGYDSDTSEIKVVAHDEVDAEKVPYLKKELDSLISENPDTKGWFYFSGPESIMGLPISAQLMQSDDNFYYLNRNEKKKYNINGSVYVDYRNNMSDIKSNRNIIVYAHARSYKRFGGLKYLDNAKRWYSDANNHFIKITTDTEQSVWQVFSWYETTAGYDYRSTDFTSPEEYVNYLNTLQSNNKIEALKKFDFKGNDTILTLSTCKGSDKNKRVAVHAVLIKSRQIQQ